MYMARNILFFVLCFSMLFGIPSLNLVHADINTILEEGIVPCGNEPGPEAAQSCTYADAWQLVDNILDIMFYIAILLTVYLLVVTGFKYLTAGSKSGQLEEAKKNFTTIGVGFLLMLSAYLIINLIVSTLLNTTEINPATDEPYYANPLEE